MTPTELQQHLAETLATLSLADRMVSIAVAPGNSAQLSEDQLQSLWEPLRALQRLELPLRLAAERIEAKAFDRDIEWLTTDHG
jgi:hypothetical protein